MSEVVRLGDVSRVQNGFAFDGQRFSTARGFPLLRIRDLKTNRPSLLYDGAFDAAYVVRHGDLLIGMDGEFRAYRWAGPEALLNQRVCRLVPDARVLDLGYLYFAIGEHLLAIEQTTGLTTVKHVSSKQIVAIQIPLSSLAQQRRIAARLTGQLAVLDRARTAATDQRNVVDALRASTYQAAFRAITPLSVEHVTEGPPRGWRWVLLTDVARLESGHTPSRSRPDWWGGDIPWIALPDIRAIDGREAYETKERTNPDGIANSSARVLPAGTVVMSRTASVGFVARLGRPMATSQDFVNWVCGPELDPEFLMHLLIRSREYVRSLASGAVHKTVYVPTVKAFRVCAPRINEQRRIAAELRERLAPIDAMAMAIEAELEEVDALPAALLRRAFEGAA